MKKIITNIFILLIMIVNISCTSEEKKNSSNSLCNDTSLDDMAEVETGFYHLFNGILYYADKKDMTTWVPVCNKADCLHESSDCNAYVGSEIAQKDDKLYFVSDRIRYGHACIYEVSLDGSERKMVYEIPFENKEFTFRGLISSSALNMSYTYLREDGLYETHIARLEENGNIYPVYSEINEEQGGNLFMAGTHFFVRGKEVVVSSRLTAKYTDKTGIDMQSVLWKMDGKDAELVTLPDDVSIGWCYLTDESCFDFGEYDDGIGYYKIDLASGEKTLLGRPLQENAWGYIMTEDCVVESNRFINQAPSDAYLRIYYKDKWLNVQLPEEVTNAQLEKTAFLPVAVASDRVFFKQSDNGLDGYSCRLYYVMLNEETPKLTYCTTFGSESYFEIKDEIEDETKGNDWTDLDITVFDTEDYLIKFTGIGLDQEEKAKGIDLYKITAYCENKTSKKVSFSFSNVAINGIQCMVLQDLSLEAGESKEHIIRINEETRESFGVSDTYDVNEYTDIAILIFKSYEKEDNTYRKIVHIYPQGEELATHYVREEQEKDQVVLDNEYVKVTVVGFESEEMDNDTAIVCIQNKTDQIIAQIFNSINTVNGITIQECYLNGLILPILPQGCIFTSITVPENLLKSHDIGTIENWQATLKLWDEENWFKRDDKISLEETISIVRSR